jgi:hypothetical protein
MAPHKATRKQDPSVEEPNPNSNIYSDTTARLTDNIKSWKQVYEILEDEKSLPSDESSEGEDESIVNKLKEVAKSELHKVVSKAKIVSIYRYDTMGSGPCRYTDQNHLQPSEDYCQLILTRGHPSNV